MRRFAKIVLVAVVGGVLFGFAAGGVMAALDLQPRIKLRPPQEPAETREPEGFACEF